MVRKNKIFNFIFASVLLIGCATVQSVSPTYLFIGSSKSIKLFLFDDRVISLRADDYTVTDNSDSSFISGNGVVSHKGSNKQETFVGVIYFREINKMDYTESTPTWQITPLLIVGSIFVVLIVIATTFKVSQI